MSTQPEEQAQTHRDVSWRSPEILGEVVLLAIVFFFAVAYLFELPGLKMPARYLPIITIIFAAPFWVIRVKSLFNRKKALQGGLIMDLGFRFGGDPAAEKRRAIRYIGSVAIFFLSVWLFGFHIALPVWVMTYLFVFGKVNPLIILIIGASFEGLLLGVHDFIIDVPWPEPLVWRWIGVEYLFNTWPIDDTF
jgi:hypothetical protein